VIVVATSICLLPFIAKPFHIDDPMYLWAGEHIRHHPLDPYGFRVTWSGHDTPMHMAMQNPPLASYLIALVASVAGMNEIALHLTFFVPALLLVIGTYRLAQTFCHAPVLAALFTISAPVFVICSTTVTCDILMVCFWVWAMYWWDRGLRTRRWPHLVGAATLVARAFKVNGITRPNGNPLSDPVKLKPIFAKHSPTSDINLLAEIIKRTCPAGRMWRGGAAIGRLPFPSFHRTLNNVE
jgi:hypothetical protein